MSTITKEFTKEQLQQIEAAAKEVLWPVVWSEKKAREHFSEKITPKVVLKLARIALASLEAEPVAYIRDGFRTDGVHFCGGIITAEEHERTKPALSDRYNWKHQPLYTAPPSPVSVPDEDLLHIAASAIDGLLSNKDRSGAGVWVDIPAKLRRAAMLQGADGTLTNEGTIPVNTPCKEAPEHIWLQTAGVWPENGEFSELTWCSDNQHEDDTLYVRADVVTGNSPVMNDYPETLPCPVSLEPGLKFGKGVPTKILLEALQRRANYSAEIEVINEICRDIKDGDFLAAAKINISSEPVTTACKLREAVETIRNSGIAIDAEKIFAECDALNAQDCWCRTCRPITLTDMRFVVCPDCGNKRCPHANDHRNACTGSNEPGQEGSAYPAAPQQEVK